jgi:YVTN family beta-propeller protein
MEWRTRLALRRPVNGRPRRHSQRDGRATSLVTLIVAGVLTAACTGSSGAATSATISAPAASQPKRSAATVEVLAASVSASRPAVTGRATARTVSAGVNPNSIAVDQATHTVYVGAGDGTVSVIDAATCSASLGSGCAAKPTTVTAGGSLVDAAVDQATDTIYVVDNSGNTMSVINGRTCNASVTSGCGAKPATVTVGDGPDGVAVDQATDTIYVANVDDNTVSVINGKTCNAEVTSGCGQTPPTVAVGVQPVVPAVDEATDTVYVPNSNPDGDGSVSVINGAICNADVTSGCGQTPPTVSVGPFPDAAAVDETTNTVYEVAHGDSLGAVYVINGATCDGAVTTGCGQQPPKVTVGSVPGDVIVDPASHQVFVANEEDSTVSVIDATACNATDSSGCKKPVPAMATGFDNGYLDVDIATDTVYVANQDENNVSVLDGAACSATHAGGCRPASPTTATGNAPVGIAVNTATHTVYVGDRDDQKLSVIDADTCSAATQTHCMRAWPTIATAAPVQAVAVNEKTDTVYTADSEPQFADDGSTSSFQGNTVSVIDGSHCNAAVVSGCGKPATSVTIGDGPAVLTVDSTTNTVYVANFNSGNVALIDGRTCNGSVTSGCASKPVTVKVGPHPDGIAVDEVTHTVYVADAGDNRVSVINAATCNARVHTGCARPPASLAVGAAPLGVGIDTATNTVYVANYMGSTISVINGATCDAATSSGCHQTPPTMATGGRPERGVAVDQATGAVFVDSVVDSAVDVFRGVTCNAKVTSGCGQPPVRVPTGGYPVGVTFDPANGTVYAADNTDAAVSFFAPPS